MSAMAHGIPRTDLPLVTRGESLLHSRNAVATLSLGVHNPRLLPTNAPRCVRCGALKGRDRAADTACGCDGGREVPVS